MIGHILSATSVEECKMEPIRTPYIQALKNFVLGDDSALDETHDIYYWFYPFKKHLSAKGVGFINEGHMTTLSLLSFFPIAFMVTEKNKGIYPGHAKRLLRTDKKIYLDLSTKGYKFSEFPFHKLEGDQIMMLTDFQTITSHPIKQ